MPASRRFKRQNESERRKARRSPDMKKPPAFMPEAIRQTDVLCVPSDSPGHRPVLSVQNNHQDAEEGKPDSQPNPAVIQDAGKDVANEAAQCHKHGIWELCGDMLQMVAVCTR